MTRLGAWALKRVLYHSGLLALARHARRERAVVLRYHALTDGASEITYATPDICLPVKAFRLQMAFARRAYTVVPLDVLVEAVTRGGPLPPRALAITFDDGYADNHRLALPVLRALDLPATVYVTTACLDGGAPLWMAAVRTLVLRATGPMLDVPGMPPVALGDRRAGAVRTLTRALVPLAPAERSARLAAAASGAGVDLAGVLRGTMLSWAQVRELGAAGWTIGAHTATHANVALAPAEEAEAEIAASRDAIAAHVGAPVRHFAYPNAGGQHRYFGPEVARLLGRLGFRSAVTSRSGVLEPGVDPFSLPRLGVSPRLAPVVDLAAAVERQRLAA